MDEYSDDDAKGLADKIAGLDLSNGEAVVLGALIEAAREDDEVAGFGTRRATLIDFTTTGAKVDRTVLANELQGVVASNKEVGRAGILPTGETAMF